MGAYVIVAGFFCLLGLLGVSIFQVYQYLRHGSWMALSLLDIVERGGIGWASRPTDWFGLHQFLDWMPLSAALFVVGIVIAWIGQVAEESAR